jgi:hypothetical protein
MACFKAISQDFPSRTKETYDVIQVGAAGLQAKTRFEYLQIMK